MARPAASQITLSGAYQSGRPPRAASDSDHRLRAPGAAENVLGAYFRANVQLDAAVAAAPEWLQNGAAVAMVATSLPEYVVPHLVLLQPGPGLVVCFNRVLLLPFTAAVDGNGLDIDPVDTVPPGDFWTYRAVLADGTVEQRVRLGIPPAPEADSDIRALLYVIDFTQG